MKTRLAAFLIVAIVVPGCFRDTPRPNTTFAPGNETTLKAAMLSGRQEVPTNASVGTGDATVVIDPSRMIVTVTVNFTGLVDTTDAHIHVGGLGQDGPIILPLASGGFTSPLVVTLTQDNLTPQTAQGITTFADAVDAIQQGRTYVNLHTTAFTGGEIRGQVGPVTMLAQLDGQQEVPPVVTSATGSMSVSLNNDQTSMTFSLTATGLSNLTAAHIHAGAVGVDAPIIFPLAIGSFTFPLSGALTQADLTPQPGVTSFPEAVDALLSGLTYANIHTALYPEGEIRGQILPFLPTNPPPAPVPPITTPPTVPTPIPGFPNTATFDPVTATPPPGYPNTGAPPTAFAPGLSTPGFSNTATTTTGTATTTSAPPVTVIGPYGSRTDR